MKFLTKTTPLQVAQRELIEAEHAKLAAQSAAEYAESMVRYNQQRIVRLLTFIKQAEGQAV